MSHAPYPHPPLRMSPDVPKICCNRCSHSDMTPTQTQFLERMGTRLGIYVEKGVGSSHGEAKPKLETVQQYPNYCNMPYGRVSCCVTHTQAMHRTYERRPSFPKVPWLNSMRERAEVSSEH